MIVYLSLQLHRKHKSVKGMSLTPRAMNTELVIEGTNEDQANNEKGILPEITKTDRSKPRERHLNKPRLVLNNIRKTE